MFVSTQITEVRTLGVLLGLSLLAAPSQNPIRQDFSTSEATPLTPNQESSTRFGL